VMKNDGRYRQDRTRRRVIETTGMGHTVRAGLKARPYF
jgi:hypothetical protein